MPAGAAASFKRCATRPRSERAGRPAHRNAVDAESALAHLELGLRRAEVILPVVLDDVVVMEEEDDYPGRVALAFGLVEEKLLVVAVAGRASVDHLRRAARG